MSLRFLAAGTAALILALSPLAHAQTAAAPASAADAAKAAAMGAAQAAAKAAADAAKAAETKAAKATAPAQAKDSSATASEGKVAYYGRKFQGRKTASGERFNASAMTMAHKTLPFGTLVKVTNLANKRSVVVRVNDRGPTTDDRIGDLTTGAARKVGMLRAGVVQAKLDVVGNAKSRMTKAKKG